MTLLLVVARSALAANNGLRRADVHVLDLARESHNDLVVNTEEDARSVAGVADVDVGDGLLDVGGSPGLVRWDGDGPRVLGGVNECDLDRGAVVAAGLDEARRVGLGKWHSESRGGESEESGDGGLGGEHFCGDCGRVVDYGD